MNEHDRGNLVIGVLALQGAFVEHQIILSRLTCTPSGTTIIPRQIRTSADLATCAALIIPGGESTTIALLARLAGLLEPLREFVRKKPVWGTCAGAILLAEAVEGTKKGGQEVFGGINVKIGRNGWGSQLESFEAPLEVDGLPDQNHPFPGVFIRAPVILSLLPQGPNAASMHVLARIPPDLIPTAFYRSPLEADETDPRDDDRTIVALRQGRHLITTFHPELTKDYRFHEYFVKECVLREQSLALES